MNADPQDRMPRLVEVMSVSPALATKWLTHNLNNRPLRRTKVLALAAKMRDRRWLFTGQSHVIFDWNGNLINGQHTLSAVVESGVTIETIVVWGVTPDAFAAIDIGLKRSGGDAIGIAGGKDSTRLGALIRLVLLHDSLEKSSSGYSVRSGSVDPDELVDVFHADPDGWETARVALREARSNARTTGVTIASDAAVGAFIYLADRAGVDPEATRKFVSHVTLDADHAEGVPATSLRRWLSRYQTTRGTDMGLVVLASWIRAWNATVQGEDLSRIFAWNRSSPSYPTIEGGAA